MNARSSRSAARPWSWSIGRLAGIDIRVHATFFLLLGWIVLSQLATGLHAVGQGVLLVAVVFTVIVLHELGHALVARRFGISTRDITLLPIGGVARLERLPTRPRHEFLVAIAGPAVNLALAVLASMGSILLGSALIPWDLAVVGGPWLAKFFWLNIGLCVFNLLPAFPMDGGRALRALLAMKMGRVRATDIAARIGRWMAAGFVLLGFFGNPMLVLIGVFVWLGASQEAAAVHMNAALDKLSVRDAMVTMFETLPVTAPLGRGAELALHTTQREFPVVDHDRLVGFVSAEDLMRMVREGAAAVPIGSVSRPVRESALPSEPVEAAMRRLMQTGQNVLPVLDAGRLVGLLVPENVIQLAGIYDRSLALPS